MKPRASLAKVRLIVAAGVLMAACGRSTPQASEPKALDLAAGTRVGAQGTRVAARGTDWFNEGLNGAGSNVNAAHAQFPVPADHAAIVVAVIDSGIDIFHEDLAAHIWKNPREIPANRVDDDQNGYVDDVNGWNFLVDKNGRDIAGETLELTREFARYYKPYLASQNGTGPALSSSDHNRLVSLYNEFAPKFRAAAPGSDEAQAEIERTPGLCVQPLLHHRADALIDLRPGHAGAGVTRQLERLLRDLHRGELLDTLGAIFEVRLDEALITQLEFLRGVGPQLNFVADHDDTSARVSSRSASVNSNRA